MATLVIEFTPMSYRDDDSVYIADGIIAVETFKEWYEVHGVKGYKYTAGYEDIFAQVTICDYEGMTKLRVVFSGDALERFDVDQINYLIESFVTPDPDHDHYPLMVNGIEYHVAGIQIKKL